ncbi:MAG: hypothetical protein RBS99_13450 [Rhodospirillales bacterium]|jgi:hypothetical protein|nr:hypothetical protein [Rhodospirillales bacterium]
MKKKFLAVLVLATFGISSTGCTVEEGVSDGVVEGLARVVTALIETPVQYWLDQQFGD